MRVDVWGKQHSTKILNTKKAVLLICWWGGYLHMCKPDTNAGGSAGRSGILLFSLNHSEPTLAAQLTAFPDPGRVSVRDLPASGAPLSRGYEGNWPLRGISSEGKHLPHCYRFDGQSAQCNGPCSHACLCSCGWLIAEQTRWLEISLSALHLRFALLLSRKRRWPNNAGNHDFAPVV